MKESYHQFLYMSFDEHVNVVKWCQQQFGDNNYRFKNYAHGKVRYTFFTEQHYNWFLLRWK